MIAPGELPADGIPVTRAGTLRGWALTSPSMVTALVGEIDMATAPALRRWMTAASTTSSARVVVDLADVGFLDCSALSEFVRARNALKERDLDFRLRSPSPTCLRLLDIAGLRELLLPEDDAARGEVEGPDHGKHGG